MAVRQEAFVADKDDDDVWVANHAATFMSSKALRWFITLPDEEQRSWDLLEKALAREYGIPCAPDSPLQSTVYEREASPQSRCVHPPLGINNPYANESRFSAPPTLSPYRAHHPLPENGLSLKAPSPYGIVKQSNDLVYPLLPTSYPLAKVGSEAPSHPVLPSTSKTTWEPKEENLKEGSN